MANLASYVGLSRSLAKPICAHLKYVAGSCSAMDLGSHLHFHWSNSNYSFCFLRHTPNATFICFCFISILI